MITGLDHVQLAMPRGAEGTARAFYAGLLGMTELPKPPVLAARGGCWFASAAAVVHLGVEDPFSPARKAHPAFLVDDLDTLQAELAAAGHDCVRTDGEVPGVRRFHTHDCFGNRIEFQQALPVGHRALRHCQPLARELPEPCIADHTWLLFEHCA